MGLDRTIGLEIGEGNHFAVYLSDDGHHSRCSEHRVRSRGVARVGGPIFARTKRNDRTEVLHGITTKLRRTLHHSSIAVALIKTVAGTPRTQSAPVRRSSPIPRPS